LSLSRRPGKEASWFPRSPGASVAEASRTVLDRITFADSLARAEQATPLPEPAE
jgi:hypothetical protein